MDIKEEKLKDGEKLTADERIKLALRIKENFNKWNEDRQTQVNDAREIIQEVYLNQGDKYKDDEDLWKSDTHLNKLYTIKKSKKANLWREMWSNPEQMFEVRGTNKETEELAPLQKASICDALRKMDIGKQYDNAVDNLLDIGEFIFKTDWEERTKTVKRQGEKGFILKNLSRIFNLPSANNTLQKIELPYYQNARVESISPFMFVFDHTNYSLHNKQSWDSCQKIYKRFEEIENIKNNKIYTLTPEQEAELKQNDDKTENNKSVDDLILEDTHGTSYEVLYLHGDIKINGKVFKNYIAEVLAGKYLIRFEENPMFINPFVMCALEYDPITKRGISILKASLKLCKTEEDLFNSTVDAQKLQQNPPVWANEDLIKDIEIIKIKPGKVLRYKNDYNGSLPKEYALNMNALNPTISSIDKVISDVSSVNNNMNGNITATVRPATELALADKGAMTQVSKELDTIYQDGTLPMIENVAELLAMFKNGIDIIFSRDKGKKLEFKITNEIRQSQYAYSYEDRNALLERKSKFKELFQLFANVAKDPEMRTMINWREVITTAVEIIGFDNSEKFFEPETALNNVFDELKQAPEEVQNIIAQQLQMQIQNFKQQMQMNKQQQAQNIQIQQQPQSPILQEVN